MASPRLDDRAAPPNSGTSEEGDIDLRDLVKVILRRRTIILVVFAAAVIVAAARTRAIPKVYEVSMFIEPPIMGLEDAGADKFDPIVNMKSTIEVGAYNRKIIDELHLGDSSLQFSVLQPKETRLIKVSLYRGESQTDDGVKILSKLLDVLNERYTESLAEKRSWLSTQIKMGQSQGGAKEGEIKIQSEVYKIRLTQPGQTLDGMREKLLSLSRDSLRNIRVIQAPFISPQPLDTRSNKGVLIAGIIGLTFGIFLAFLVEYWDRRFA